MNATTPDTLTLATFPNGARLIRSGTDSVTIPAADVAPLRAALSELDAAPRLWVRLDDAEVYRISAATSWTVGNDGEVCIVVGRDAEPCAAVCIGVGEIGLVVRGLS
jgi:hypothetical protein